MDQIKKFNSVLKSFKIKAECVDFKLIDNYFHYDLKLLPGAKVKDVSRYSDEISLAIKAHCKPLLKILRDNGVIRLEFLSPRTIPLKLFDLFSNVDVPDGEINCLLGNSANGSKVWMDLANNPHMIVSGTTGSGKSVLLHNIIANLINYNNVDLYLIDPKRIEFIAYEGFKSISLTHSYNGAMRLINSALEIMDFRYEANQRSSLDGFKPIVIIIDEFADLIMQDKDDEFYIALCRLAQKCRAAKIHIILSTQRPSANIISGAIKANFPARIACRVASHIDSKVVLDASGAENLLGNGDALIRDNFRFLERFQIAYTNAEEIRSYYG